MKEKKEEILRKREKAFEDKENLRNFNIDNSLENKKKVNEKQVKKATENLVIEAIKVSQNNANAKVSILENKKLRKEL